jgi:DNA-binding MarR family transcriptional regulator
MKKNRKGSGLVDQDFSLDALRVWRHEDLIDYVLSDLDTRVKKDKPVKLSVLFTGLSSFLHDPMNLCLKGESGSGKTYNTTETLKYFPEDRIWFLGGMSRKSLVHSHGVLLNKNDEEIDLDYRPVKPHRKEFEDEEDFKRALQQYQEDLKDRREEMRDSYTLVDLTGKILVFLESPDFETFQMLRPILSHDKEMIQYQFVDKTGKGQLQTRKVVLKGWPAALFLTTDVKYVEEMATRSFTATPENSEGKILEANVLTNMKASLPWQYAEETHAFKVISQLVQRLQEQSSESKVDVVNPFLNLYEMFPHEISRDMRDFQHFTQFLKTVTLLHYFQRPYMKLKDSRLLIASLEDVRKALNIYKEIFETTRTGTEKRILDFYHKIIKTKQSWYLKELTCEYNKTAKKKLSEDSIRVMLLRLDQIGYVNSQRDDEDKRKNLYIPLMKGEEKGENPLENAFRVDFDAKMKKGFESWKENIRGNPTFYYYRNNSENPGTWGENEIGLEDLDKLVLTGNADFSSSVEQNIPRLISNEDSRPKPEISLETERGQDSKQFSDNSTEPKGLIECPDCKAQGRKMFFMNDADLAAHARTHSNDPEGEGKNP